MRRVLTVFAIVLAGCQTTSTVPSGSGLNICADFRAHISCAGGPYNLRRSDGTFVTEHNGIDFQAAPGTPVISATHGKVTEARYYPNGGGIVTVQTPIKAGPGKYDVLYAKYIHLDRFRLTTGLYKQVKPGDIIGYVAAEEDRGRGPVPHLHFELRYRNKWKAARDPHPHWVNGPGKITCYAPGLVVPFDKMVAPIRCR